MAFSSPPSFPPPPPPQTSEDGAMSRRSLLYWPIGVGGAVVYGKLVSDAVGRLSRGDLVYPPSHERAISQVISQSLQGACRLQPSLESLGQMTALPLRILEIGIGKECRVIRRGLYEQGLERIASLGVSKVDILGIDLSRNLPSERILQQTRENLEQAASRYGIQATLNVQGQSITQPLTLADGDSSGGGSFDAVLSFLTLCSVDNPDAAIQNIRQLIRPDGGIFGYVEHVAVSDADVVYPSYRFLEWQQQVLDPVQQALADNCHLHRYTDDKIAEIFQAGTSTLAASRFLSQEHFLVDDMWPVSYQASGVVQRLL